MNIVKERTRIIFSEYNDAEKRAIDNMVATMDNVFTYEDKDKHIICLPTGMEKATKRLFPKHTIVDKSNEYWAFDHIQPVEHNAQPRNQLQKDFISFVLEKSNHKQKLAGILSPGTGKGLVLSTRLPAPNPEGFIKMGDIKVGDRIFGSDGKVVNVTGVYPQGEKDIYEVIFNDGRSVFCDAEHLWTVTVAWPSKPRTISVEEMLKDYKFFIPHIARDNERTGSNRDPWHYKYRVQLLSSPVEYDPQEISVHPYVLGAFIGNGCCTIPELTLSSGNDFVPNKIAKLCGFTTKKMKHNYNYPFYDANGHMVKTADFFKDIPEMIGSYSRDKIIPSNYMYNSIHVRMELLRGLMDTDGSICSEDGIRYNVSYSSCSKKLLEQIQELIWGLGYSANIIKPDNRTEKYVDGYHSQVNIRVPQKFKQELFTHPRKLYIAQKAASIPDRQQPFKYLIIKDIKLVKREESQCISVDAPDQLYLTEQFIVTHNTFMTCYSAIRVGLRTLIIVPTTSIKNQWADTLTGMFGVDPSRVINVKKPSDFFNVKADFVVVSQASLAAINKTYDLEEIMRKNKFGIKAIDEVQMWFHNIIKVDGCSNIANNWYLTGTFGRSSDDQNKLYQEMFGDLAMFTEKMKEPTFFNRKPGNIYGMKPHVHCTMVWTRSGLNKEQIKKVTNSMRYSEREGKWMRFGISVPAYTKLVIPPDGTMTKWLNIILRTVKIAMNTIDYGKTLVLGSTISSAEVIASYLRKMYPKLKIGTLHSINDKATNLDTKANADIIVSTTKSAGTGFDVKGLSRLIVADQFKSWILADQVSGRLRTLDSGKDTYMWDIVDSSIPQLRRWANSRAQVLKRKTKSFKVKEM
jgi:hypothetical protein|nr:MAG TPA: Cas system-associated protein [Caudoviricetes sp.]